MVEGDLRSHLCVLLVGVVRDDLVRGLSDLADECEVPVVRCDDVYDAVARCAASRGMRFLAVGPLAELARENARFFAIATRNGGTCCALIEGDGSLGRDSVLAAVGVGVSLAAGMDQIRGVFERWLGFGGCGLGRSDVTPEEYQASEAELNALLGQDVDG